MKTVLTTLGVVACAARFGYLHAGPEVEYREDFSFTKAAGASGELTLENVNGDVTITGVDGLTSVEISGVKIIRDRSMEAAKSHSGDVRIDTKQSSSGVDVKTIYPDGMNSGSYSVVYQVRVPSGWKVSVENVNGDVKVASVNNGVSVELTNGTLETNAIKGNLMASLVNGKIHGDAALPENGACKLEITNGEIDARLMVPATASCDLQAVNGPITLSLPKSASASISADAAIGDVAIDGLSFAKMNRSGDMGPGESFTGVLGGGNSAISLSVTNGSIALKGY